jgi:uncharacterized protein YciI
MMSSGAPPHDAAKYEVTTGGHGAPAPCTAGAVALVQACQDARRAHRNWFDSMSGKRKGRKAGHPRSRSRKDNRQSVRLTRNGFALHGGRVFIAKVGNVRIRWSRPLPSEPSSAIVIREADGRYYVSFVVERDARPLPVIGRETVIDVGLDRLAVTSDGEIIANPRFLHPPRDDFAATMTDDEKSVWAEHFDRLQRLLAAGQLILAGPTLGRVNTGVAVFEAPGEDAARQIMAADPAISGGYARGELRPFRVALLRGRD